MPSASRSSSFDTVLDLRLLAASDQFLFLFIETETSAPVSLHFLLLILSAQFNKKPYNPILGETMRCFVEVDGVGRADYVAEQVNLRCSIWGQNWRQN